jgi:hypothetical protein
MYAAAHTSLALAAKRTAPTASLFGLMVAAQAGELLWVGLNYAGIEHSTVDDHGTLHLKHLPYSHSLLVGLGIGALLWAALRWLFPRPQLAAVFGWVAASHIVLDVIQHEPNIRLVPWLAHPVLGLNLQASPWLDFAVETAFCVGCWAYYRGSRKLLAAILVLNVLNLPLMLAGEGSASPMAHNPFVLPTTILITVLLAWGSIHRYARADATADQTAADPAPASATVDA